MSHSVKAIMKDFLSVKLGISRSRVPHLPREISTAVSLLRYILELRWIQERFSLVTVMCCTVQSFAMGRSFVLGSHTECVCVFITRDRAQQ
jgi:hypothetical protein